MLLLNFIVSLPIRSPKLYWQILYNLRFEDDNRNSSYDTHINWEQVAQHFQSQGKPENFGYCPVSNIKLKSLVIALQ
jgi:hypothetical protein